VRAIDGFGGVQLPLLGGQLDTAGGYRVDTREGDEGETIIDYKQAFVEADLSIPVFRKHNFELQLEYRNISKQGNDFQDFTIAVSYRPFKWFSGGASYEYTTEFNSIDTEGEISPRQHFGAVQATFNFTELSHARLFAGSTRGGLRCVDGFCRIFPPFIGVRTELVLQF